MVRHSRAPSQCGSNIPNSLGQPGEPGQWQRRAERSWGGTPQHQFGGAGPERAGSGVRGGLPWVVRGRGTSRDVRGCPAQDSEGHGTQTDEGASDSMSCAFQPQVLPTCCSPVALALSSMSNMHLTHQSFPQGHSNPRMGGGRPWRALGSRGNRPTSLCPPLRCRFGRVGRLPMGCH